MHSTSPTNTEGIHLEKGYLSIPPKASQHLVKKQGWRWKVKLQHLLANLDVPGQISPKPNNHTRGPTSFKKPALRLRPDQILRYLSIILLWLRPTKCLPGWRTKHSQGGHPRLPPTVLFLSLNSDTSPVKPEPDTAFLPLPIMKMTLGVQAWMPKLSCGH